tara:strand:- start:72411 stop:74198 length:1788 start_codon:yes stop_codon:yes gene_type:complete
MALQAHTKNDIVLAQGRVTTTIAVLGGSVGLGAFFIFSAYFIQGRLQVPFWDGVNILHFLYGNPVTGDVPNLFHGDAFQVKDNEHRPVFPMFLWQFDQVMFKSTGLFPVLVSHLFAAATTLIILSGLIRRVTWPLGLLTAGAGLALVFAPMNYENLLWEKQVHVYMSLFFSILSLWLAASKVGGSDLRADAAWILIIGIFSFVASFSFGYGMVVWPVLIVHALLCKWRWPLTGTIVLIFLLTTALYASTWITHPAHDNPAETLFHPLGLLKYMATFLFAPLTRVMHLPLGWFGNQTQIAGGLCLLAVFVFGAFRNYLIPKAEYGRGRFSVMVGAFCIGIAFITALGRLTINAGVDSRYLIVPIMFLITLPGTIWFDHKHNSVPKNACLVLYFYLLIGTAISSLFTYRNDIEHIKMLTIEGALAAEFKISDSVHGLHPNTSVIDEQVWPHYRREQNVIGRKMPYSWPGKPFGTVFGLYGFCPGRIETLRPVAGHPGTYSMEGWSRFGDFGEMPADWVVAVDQDAIIQGLARPAAATPELEKQLSDLYPDSAHPRIERSGLVGYVTATSDTILDFYAVHDEGICRFASGLAVPGPDS